jgi:hypothetical protein
VRPALAPRRRWLPIVALASLNVGLGACDFAHKTGVAPTAASSPAAPASTQARLSVSILPDPILVLRDRRDPTSLAAHWTVQILETAGVGGTLGFVNATVRDADTGAPVGPQGFLSMDTTEIRKQVGTDRLAPGGRLAVPQSLTYNSEASAAMLAVAVQVLDDNGNVVSSATTARLE